jgi:dihydrofolate reductase
MRKVIVNEWMSLDGVVQAPGAADEDTTGGFEHGGWHLRYFDDLSRRWVAENLTGAGGFLLGRRTYENFAAHWPKASEEEQALAQPLNTLPKYVASTTLAEPLVWQNSRVLQGDLATAVVRRGLPGPGGAGHHQPGPPVMGDAVHPDQVPASPDDPPDDRGLDHDQPGKEIRGMPAKALTVVPQQPERL